MRARGILTARSRRAIASSIMTIWMRGTGSKPSSVNCPAPAASAFMGAVGSCSVRKTRIWALSH
ncbi:hypothetical protein [Paracoccus sp. SSK6]|uniref:hypothetical protein n=1 Tax=Paracoccus sp. SSK6 TaxID=3143131 RepID=UPI00321BB1C9